MKNLGGAFLTIVVIAALYVGAYFATVRPMSITRTTTIVIGGGPVELSSDDELPRVPRYEVPEAISHYVVETFFAPIHHLDRRFRPATWDPPSKEKFTSPVDVDACAP